MILPIVKEHKPILHKKAVPVTKVTPEIVKLVADMIDTMRAAEGVGLAANQVDSPLDILVASPDGKKGEETVLFNALLTEKKGRHRSPEGCLSLPGVSSEVVRSTEVTVQGLDREGKPVTIHAEGLLARILQHEVDHLSGKLYVDRLLPWERANILGRYRNLMEELKKVQL